MERSARVGRPRGLESERRKRHLLRLLTEGWKWLDAAREARVKPDTVLRLLDDEHFSQVAAELLAERRRLAQVA